MTAPMLTRARWRSLRELRPAFVDWRTGRGAHDQGSFDFRACANLGDFLDGMPEDVERVFVTGARIGDTPDGFAEWMASDGGEWEPAPAGHYLEGSAPILRYCGPEGRRIVVQRASAWFGEEPFTAAQAMSAWSTLRLAVTERWEGSTLLATPGTTGRDLFVRSLGERVYPLASAEHQSLIRATSGQGRDELRPAPEDDDGFALGLMDGLAEYDGRLMYGALCWGLGSGVAVDQEASGPAAQASFADEFRRHPQRRGRYLIKWRVPHWWRHVGLVGEWRGGRWQYPARPGDSGTSWVDGAELALLVAHQWPFAIARRLLLHESEGVGPLDRWARKLVALRFALATTGERLAAAGARAMLLHALGAFMGTSHTVTRATPIEDQRAVPHSAINPRIEGAYIVWGEPRATAWPELSHPEWSAAVYGRCRARLLSGPASTGALHVPASHVVAFRTDAVYLTSRPDWSDDGQAGRLRLVSWAPGPLPWPQSTAELLRMRAR